MAHDRRRPQRRARRDAAPGWAWMLFGFSIGLVVAVVVYLGSNPSDRAPTPTMSERSAPAQERAASVPEPAPSPQQSGTRFDFYEILPSFEVVVPEVESRARVEQPAAAVSQPGRYIVQAGSFREHADADRMQASLALLGIESRIQKVTIDADEFHRVRIGPISDLDELNSIRRRLREAGIDSLLMQLP